jgi:hypothetical protein
MIMRLLRQVRIVSRFLWPSRATRHYVRQIQASNQFDRAFYFGSNPRLRRLFRLAPERHYALFGEPAGLCPNPGFSPRAYLYNNPDLAGARPLQHYIETGRAEQRTVLRTDGAIGIEMPEPPGDPLPADPAPVAVSLHLYYHHMWPEFAERLAAQTFRFDLFVTLTGGPEDTAPLRDRIRATFPEARVWALPNHGRDILPFLWLLRSGLLSPYQAVCKLHSKKSPHRGDGDAWRQTLTEGVLGDAEVTQARLNAFLADTGAGIWVAEGQHYHGDDWWGMNRARTTELLARVGLNPDQDAQELAFPAGSIYWAKPAVLERLDALALGPADFEPEQALVDGTTAHAIERAMGYLTRAAGAEIREPAQLDR